MNKKEDKMYVNQKHLFWCSKKTWKLNWMNSTDIIIEDKWGNVFLAPFGSWSDIDLDCGEQLPAHTMERNN